MTDTKINVIADDREVPSGVPNLLFSTPGIEMSLGRLPLGDYLVNERIIFERKTLLDLVASITDGRLFRQGHRLANSRLQSVLILEGTGADLSGCHMRREAIQGALITLTIGFGIPLLRSTGPEETVRLMLYAARQFDTARVHRAFPRHFVGGRPNGKHKRQLHILQGLPGIGPERAQRLLDRFTTVQAVLNATVAELIETDTIGEQTARSIRAAVSEDRASYCA
jgi:DNA excision repair protein ERCC-4